MTELTLEMAEQAWRAAQTRARELRAPMTDQHRGRERPARAVRARRRHRVLHAGDVECQGRGGGGLPPVHHELAELAAKGSAFWTAVPAGSRGPGTAHAGWHADHAAGRMIGGIGCGGGTGEQDQQCADAGAAAVK